MPRVSSESQRLPRAGTPCLVGLSTSGQAGADHVLRQWHCQGDTFPPTCPQPFVGSALPRLARGFYHLLQESSLNCLKT